MSDQLRATLQRLSQPGAGPNEAYDRLLADYARFHLVLAVLAAALVIAAAASAVSAWRHLRSAPPAQPSRRGWPTFERATWAVGLVASIGFGLLMGLLAAANLSNAVAPRQGFRDSIPMISQRAPGTRGAAVQQAFDRWLRSGDPTMPPAVRAAVDDRLAWQRPKAVICTILLVLVLVGARRVWRSLLARTRRPDHRWGIGDLARLGVAATASATALLLVLMVMGNTQASLAPLSMTLFSG